MTTAVAPARAGNASSRRGTSTTIAAARPLGFAAKTRAARVALSGSYRSPASLSISSRRVETVTRAMAETSSGVKIIVQGRNIKITDAIREYCDTKLGRAVTHFDVSDGIREVDVQCSVRGGEVSDGAELQKTEVTVYTKHGIVRAEEEGDNLYKSIDLVSDKLERKLRKLKERQSSKASRHGRKSAKEVAVELAEAIEDASMVEEDDEGAFDYGTIVREKFHAVSKMSINDAVEEMEQVGHGFYAFRNAKDGEINIVYKRNAGGYGVLIPCEFDDASADPGRK